MRALSWAAPSSSEPPSRRSNRLFQTCQAKAAACLRGASDSYLTPGLRPLIPAPLALASPPSGWCLSAKTMFKSHSFPINISLEMPSAAPEIHLSPARGVLEEPPGDAPRLCPLPPPRLPASPTHILRFHAVRTTSPPCNRALSARIIYKAEMATGGGEQPGPWTLPLAKLNKRPGTLCAT